MSLNRIVNLPRTHVADFPDRCVRCGCDPEGKSIRIWTHSIGWWTIVFWMFGRGFAVRIPACPRCAWSIRLQRTGGTIAIVAFTCFFMFFLWPYLVDFVPAAFRKWVAMGLILMCFSPWFLWEVYFPPAVEITAYSESVNYTFLDSSYAYDFAEMNEHADWVYMDENADWLPRSND